MYHKKLKMIKKLINGYEHFECSRCGEEANELADYCQICGHNFDSIEEETYLEDTASDYESICIVFGARKSSQFIFTQLKIDMTPSHLLNIPGFNGQRMMAEPNHYHFYVFKSNKYPHLREGTQINLNMDYYESFYTSNRFRIYYDKRHFSITDINELKSYNFKS